VPANTETNSAAFLIVFVITSSCGAAGQIFFAFVAPDRLHHCKPALVKEVLQEEKAALGFGL